MSETMTLKEQVKKYEGIYALCRCTVRFVHENSNDRVTWTRYMPMPNATVQRSEHLARKELRLGKKKWRFASYDIEAIT